VGVSGGAGPNDSGSNYVAYLFAHNAGGFGLTGTDNVISCGSFTVSSGTGSTDVNLGYEPQWLLAKPSTDPGFATNWNLYDTMRGWVNTTNAGNVNKRLNPNLSQAESADKTFQPTATGFTMLNSEVYPGVPITYIYIAIRRGPMKVPTDATKVFAPNARTATGADANITGIGFPPDLVTSFDRTGNTGLNSFFDKLRGPGIGLSTASTDAQFSGGSPSLVSFNMDGISVGPDTSYAAINFSTRPYVNHYFRRAPGFFDVVCYTGNSTAGRTVAHNLTVVPELFIVKRRDTANDWYVYSNAEPQPFGFTLNSTDRSSAVSVWNSTAPTSSVFTVSANGAVNATGGTYVAYLFATCPGVSKVFSFTGNGTTQTINCGFTGGARFVMIKRTDSTGNWLVVDTARGLVSAGDPTLYLNSTAAEVTGVDWIDPDNSGFIVNQEGTMNANVSSATYIGLAIA
jgi:hypothetical protein